MDLLCTYSEHVSEQIARQLEQHVAEKEEFKLLVTGGGAFNGYLVSRIKAHLDHHITMVLPDKELIKYKEGLVFALMGLLRINGLTNCLSSVTGAVRNSCSGSLIGTLTHT